MSVVFATIAPRSKTAVTGAILATLGSKINYMFLWGILGIYHPRTHVHCRRSICAGCGSSCAEPQPQLFHL